jgi:hypothetical protein
MKMSRLFLRTSRALRTIEQSDFRLLSTLAGNRMAATSAVSDNNSFDLVSILSSFRPETYRTSFFVLVSRSLYKRTLL